jgi:hypothetical protein
MKKTLALITILALASCSTPVDPRLITLGDRLITYGERHKVITSEDAALIRDAGLIVLTPVPATIETTSGK